MIVYRHCISIPKIIILKCQVFSDQINLKFINEIQVCDFCDTNRVQKPSGPCYNILVFWCNELDGATDNKAKRLYVTKNMHNSCFFHLVGVTCTQQCLPSPTYPSTRAYSAHPGPCNGNPRPTSTKCIFSRYILM